MKEYDIFGILIDKLRSDADEVEKLREKLKDITLTESERDLLYDALWKLCSRH